MIDVTESTIKVICSNGKRDTFLVWKAKFMEPKEDSLDNQRDDDAILSKSDYKLALASGATAWMNAQKRVLKQYESPTSAYSDLLLSMDVTTSAGRAAFAIVHYVTTTANPDGDPNRAFDLLMKK